MANYDYGNSIKNAHVGVQWKGTDVCFDFYCDCGFSGHYDGYNAYAIECQKCGKKYDMAYSIELKPFTDTFEPVLARNDEDS